MTMPGGPTAVRVYGERHPEHDGGRKKRRRSGIPGTTTAVEKKPCDTDSVQHDLAGGLEDYSRKVHRHASNRSTHFSRVPCQAVPRVLSVRYETSERKTPRTAVPHAPPACARQHKTTRGKKKKKNALPTTQRTVRERESPMHFDLPSDCPCFRGACVLSAL